MLDPLGLLSSVRLDLEPQPSVLGFAGFDYVPSSFGTTAVSSMNCIAKFFALGFQEKRLFIEAWLTLVGMRTALCATQLKRLIERVSRQRTAQIQEGRSVEMIIRAVERASTAVPGGRNCLVKALAAELMLQRAGHTGDLKIGVAKPDPLVFKAHAWVEVAGKPVIGQFERDEYLTLSHRALERLRSDLSRRAADSDDCSRP